MTELKTLRELADKVGFPFDAIDTQKYKFHCAAITPRSLAIGWDEDGNLDSSNPDVKCWTLAPKKKVLKSFVYQNTLGEFVHHLYYRKNPEEWCKEEKYKLIKILDEIEVDV